MHAQMSLGSLCFGFLSSPGLLSAEKFDFLMSTPLSNRSCLCAAPGEQDGATWAKSLTQSRSEWRKVASKGQVGVKFGGSVRGAVVELWERPETDGPQPQIKSSQRSKSV